MNNAAHRVQTNTYAKASEIHFVQGFCQTCDSNKPVQVRRKVIVRNVFEQTAFETRKREIHDFVF